MMESNPKLIVVTGRLKVKSIDLDHKGLAIGRDPSNSLLLNDLSVSRQHCIIEQQGFQFQLRDLGSHTGTFLNGAPIKEHLLVHGDQIRIGNFMFLFLLQDAAGEGIIQKTVEFDDSTIATNSAIQLRPEDVLSSVGRHLNALMKISLKINTIRSLDALQQQLIESIFDSVPAERVAVLLFSHGLEEPDAFWGRTRAQNGGLVLRVSRTVTRQVLREGVALLSNDIRNESFADAQSLISLRVCSLMCVPLVSNQHRLGLIYMDTSEPSVTFKEDDLRLATAVTNIAAVALENVLYLETVEQERQRLVNTVDLEHKMIGESAAMQNVYEKIGKVSASDSTVLILGPSGTGKELVAHAIHQNSARAAKPFIALNCAALTDTLLESEIFGHEKGAFTGAIALKKGKIELADGGTLFLDEIGELALVLQAKLLRVLQEREFERVGGTRTLKVDVRVIAATNRNLAEAITQRTFRDDLYYRLNVVSIQIPALRERRDDIQLLASYFAAKYGEKCKRPVRGLTAEARACIAAYDWPGNVRELENAIERAIVLGSSDFLTAEDLPETILESSSRPQVPLAKYYEEINEAKRSLVLRAIEQAGGNYSEAAKMLGIHPNNLHRLIRNLNLRGLLKG
jgi:transcriptional regulator with GAF, ATPase, and Fis domain